MKFNIKRALVALTLPAALGLGACGGAVAQPEAAPSSAAPSPSISVTPTPTPTPTVAGFATAAALKDAAVTAGLPCDDWVPMEPDEYDDWIEAGECAHGKEHSTLYVYASADEATESVELLTDDSTWEHPIVFADNWEMSPSGDLTGAQLEGVATGLDAKLFEQSAKNKKLYAEIAKRADKTKRFSTWEKNMRNKPDGNVLESYYDRGEAVVEVCGTLIDAGGVDAGYDEAASNFESNFNEERIESWSPDPDVTVESFAGSFVELVWTTDVCGVDLD